ncbi:hypothetical protein NVP1081O_121 [Vibrio phage 1.081.O._10N.286.52.C2]|nr:hypothetical protein NVP1081O_121 [Vibrio phage 1.081.O._10N.286.52.C2]
MIIFENVQSQAAIEQASREIMDALSRRLDQAIQTGDFSQQGLAVNTSRLNIRTTERELNSLLEAGIAVFMKLDESGSDMELGAWLSRIANPHPTAVGSIKLSFNVAGVSDIESLSGMFDFERMAMESTLSHELQHAYDNWRSGDNEDIQVGTKTLRGKNNAWVDKKMLDHVVNGTQASHEEYMNYSHEINARYTQAIADTKARFRTHVKGNIFMDAFRDNFEGWDDIPADQQKRLLARAGAEHSASRKKFHGKPSDLKRALRGFDVDFTIDSKYSAMGYWFSKFEYDGHKYRALLEQLELLAIKTSGTITIPLTAFKNDSAFDAAMRDKIRAGDWDTLGTNNVIYRS